MSVEAMVAGASSCRGVLDARPSLKAVAAVDQQATASRPTSRACRSS
jgi:hypothetical protein